MSQISDQTLERYEAWRAQADPSDPVPEELRELAAGAALMRESLRHEAQSVPDMAFEAMWKRVESEIQQPTSGWSSFWARWTQSWRIPVTAVGGACAVALLWIVVSPKDVVEPQMRTAMLPEPAQMEAMSTDVVALAQAEPEAEVEAEAEPEASDVGIAPPDGSQRRMRNKALASEKAPQQALGVNIEKIDFAQGGGRIDKIEHARGTTTVVWIDAARKKARTKKAMEL